ncbi:uncharacterized protein C4orf36 homolog [Rhineura floridana]|uniref:uncharacterized protein C4orf36 homolog n=1 Tax=Rhineura floridana TaxID=261503 RepID=UPI002AC832AC|nr:uncharacterized protein C4orf36 homolog [Rhineura floridana]XP_061439073.1 uncharacterized protein C4orf36 homolog [Rhineura floridana]XP_061439074.1 uncharacterized protein C4orf36 homolog [Rhineura floridana]
MEYDFHRKRKLESVLKASGYKVHDRAEFAEITKRLLQASAEQIGNPLHHDICWGSPFNLRHVTTILSVRIPSLQAIESERILERQRFEKIELQHKIAQQVGSELKSRILLERRPLPPSGPN